MRANFVDIYLQGMRDRRMRSGTELAREIKLTDWSMAGNLSNRSSGVQIPRDICTRLKRYLYSAFAIWAANVCLHFRPSVSSVAQLPSLCLEVCLSFVVCLNISLQFIQLLLFEQDTSVFYLNSH